MNTSALVWTIIVLALVAANLPFLSNRALLVRRAAGPKPLALRLLELCLLYGLVGLLAIALEQRVGRVASQGWEFYAVTACLFLTLAFPGFVYRYLYRRS